MFKNVASQRIYVYAYDTAAEAPKTGDAANITAQISKDGGISAATNDVNPTELDAVDHPGVYYFDATQAETNADEILITPVSSTADVIFDPVLYYTRPPNFPGMAIASGIVESNLKQVDGDATLAAFFKAALARGIRDTVDSGFVETSTQFKGGGLATLSATDDAYKRRYVIFANNQGAEISAYNGTTKVFTLKDALATVPSDSDEFVIL